MKVSDLEALVSQAVDGLRNVNSIEQFVEYLNGLDAGIVPGNPGITVL